jgi:hypothetical protein
VTTRINGVDTTDHTLTGATLKAAGKAFVCRYYSNHHVSSTGVPDWKDLRKAELAEKAAAGVRIVSNWELMANPPNSRAVGQSHAELFLAENAELGGPEWAFVYYAIDTPAHAHDFDNYAMGWADRIDPSRLGCYGDGAVFRQLKADGLITKAWQSMSRSFPGNSKVVSGLTVWDQSGADIIQTSGGTLSGHSVDFD